MKSETTVLRRHTSLLLSSTLVAACACLYSQATDLIDTSSLEERGVAFETDGEGFFAMSTARGIGDINGDGFGDIAVAARETIFLDAGPLIISIVYGRPGMTGIHRLNETLSGRVVFGMADEEFTQSGSVQLAPAGDIDRDGLDDFFFGYSQYRGEPHHGKGAAFLVYGSKNLEDEHLVEDIAADVRGTVFLSTDPSWSRFDQGLANVGDFDGDGQQDIALGAYFSEEGDGPYESIIFVFFDPENLPPIVDLSTAQKEPRVLVIYGGTGQATGKGIEPVGDVNADGFDDFAILAGADIFGGWVHLIHGGPEPPDSIDLGRPSTFSVTTIQSPGGNRLFADPGQVTGIGDLDGDGFDDVFLGLANGEVNFPGDIPQPSMAYVVYGQAEMPEELNLDAPANMAVTIVYPPSNDLAGDAFGVAAVRAGDMNGDGIVDLAIGAHKKSVRGRTGAGEANILFGSRERATEILLHDGYQGINISGSTSGGALGREISPCGDFNGDGVDDLLVMAPNVNAFSGQGRAYLIYGTGTGNPPFKALRIQPNSGPLRGGTSVVIAGTGFVEGAQVFFDGRPAAQVSVVSGVEMRVVTPPSAEASLIDLLVLQNGETSRLAAAYEYVPNLPEIHLDQPGQHNLLIESSPDFEIGRSLSFGDLNGDRFDDLAIGSESIEGWVVSIVYGGLELPTSLMAFQESDQVSIVTHDDNRQDRGIWASVIGDVNSDSLDDLGIGLSDGSAWILFGNRNLPRTSEFAELLSSGGAIRIQAENLFANYTRVSFARLGDVTDDQVDDFVLAMSGSLSLAAGQICIIAGRDNWPTLYDLGTEDAYVSRISGIGTNFGHEIAAVGDADGDGSPDLLASSTALSDFARCYLIRLTPELPLEIDVETYIARGGGLTLDRVGRDAEFTSFIHVAAPGDVDGDGYDDILLGDETGGSSSSGSTFLIRGGPNLPRTIELRDESSAGDGILQIVGGDDRIQSGRALGPAGDFNADGFPDFLVGAQNTQPFDPGNLSVIFGGQTLPDRIDLRRPGRHGFRLEGTHDTTLLDVSNRETGDLNGDGRPDFAFSERGSPTFPSPEGIPSAGAVHIIFGLSANKKFVRGDATFDGNIDISDAVFILSFLFTGGPSPGCMNAADADDDGSILITDPIYLLNFLFLGGTEPPAPHPEPGIDSTEDSLDCWGF